MECAVKLYNDATSPFGRKALVAAQERGVVVTEVIVDISKSGPLDAVNPLRMIPALLTDDGQAIYDSDVIIGYLDTCHDGSPLIPKNVCWRIWTCMSLGNGLMEAVLLRVLETRRTDNEKSPAFVAKMEARISRALNALELEVPHLDIDPPTADQITLACALEYTDFRFSETWRTTHPKLEEWLGEFAMRPSMTSTRPTRSVK
jgi:glutathione S-transferase